jgi:uncharacterized lipoprotein YajG
MAAKPAPAGLTRLLQRVCFARDWIQTRVARAGYLLVLVTASGCAWVPQSATLRPAPAITASSAGNGVELAVRVVDRRSSEEIGRRGVDSRNAPITTRQNVTQVFEKTILRGLGQKGFSASRFEGQPGRLLTVELRKLEYTTDMEYWKGVVRTETELHASMFKDGVKFERLYSGRRSQNVVEAPSASTNERLINEALSEALERLLEDAQLIRFLAE